MFNSISRGVLRKSRDQARLETAQSLLQTVGSSQQPNPQIRAEFAAPVRSSSSPYSMAEGHRGAEPAARSEGKAAEDRINDQGFHSQPGKLRAPRILSVGGGKGGIGKSFLSANLAVCLAKNGYSVALVDLDLGAANLHTCLGVPNPKIGIFDFVNSRIDDLQEAAVETGIEGLRLYGGGQEFWQQVRPQSVQKVRLISKLQSLDSDYVILDLGAGTHVNTLDFFIFSHAGLLVVVPEPTSIENAYVFLKSVMYRKLQSIIKAIREESACEELLSSLGDPRIATPPFAQIESFAARNPNVGNKIIQLIRMTRLGIVMNQVRTPADIEIGHSMSKICDRYFGFSSRFLGQTHYDDEAWKSVRGRRALCHDRPSAVSALDIANLANVVSTDFLPAQRLHRESEKG